jgi:putative membrane protein
MIQPLLQIALSAISIYLASIVVPGISLVEPWSVWNLLLIGLIFGVMNAVVKPIVLVLSVPLLIVTLGLFYLIVNALILWLTSAFFDVFYVSGFWAAFFGSIIVSAFNWALNIFFGIERR